MEPKLFWGLFSATGQPLAYMLFRSAEQEEQEERSADREKQS